MPFLSLLGIIELTVGVLSGWLMVMTLRRPTSCGGWACARWDGSARPTSTS